jgi:hypothetical protein
MKPLTLAIAAAVGAVISLGLAVVRNNAANDDDLPVFDVSSVEEQRFPMDKWVLPNGVEIVRFAPSEKFFCMVATHPQSGVAMVCASGPDGPKGIDL